MSKYDLIEQLFDLKGKTALITGGGAGLGLIMTETLAKFGANIIIISRKETNVSQTAKKILSTKPHGFVQSFTGDLGQEKQIS